ncbi:MAG: hypothetical protein ACR2GY_04585 [Phycisphaerales bacterium]
MCTRRGVWAPLTTAAPVVLLLLMIGCATQQHRMRVHEHGSAAHLPATAPEDFALDVRVVGDPDEADPGSIDDRSARYVLVPGGDLHARSTTTGRTAEAASEERRAALPRIRTLHDVTIDALWRDIVDSGILSATSEAAGNVEAIEPSTGQTMTIVRIVANGRVHTLARVRQRGESVDSAVQMIVHTLAELAWMGDGAENAARAGPHRYDFGPDPYAVYREGSAQ